MKKGFSKYFELANVLYKDKGSHDSVNLFNKYMTLMSVNLCHSTRGLFSYDNVLTGKAWYLYKYKNIYLYRETHTHICIGIYTHTYAHTNHKLFGPFCIAFN